MQSISFLDDHYPLKTVISDREDCQSYSEWQDGVSRKSIIEAYLRTPVKRVFYASETHSGSVLAVPDENGGSLAAVEESLILGPPGGYDAMVTSFPGILLCVWTADCIPVFLYDTAKHAAAIAHCGWRGICNGIVGNTLKVMARRFGSSPENILAAFGPGICGDCYEVGGELIRAFSARFSREELGELFRPKENGKYLLDLRQAIVTELIEAGAEFSNIFDTGICSYESESFASCRRDGRSIPCRQTLSGIVLL